MLRPVGSQPPSVYWRRRLVLLGSAVLLVVLVVVTVRALTSDGSPSAPAAAPVTTNTPAGTSSTPPPATSASSAAPRTTAPTTRATSSAAPSTQPPATCQVASLGVKAVVASSTYKVGASPVLELQVTNTGATPCVQDLSDKQIVLMVYNGESRVWGSHDCAVQPGTQLRTLAAGASVRVTVTWSGLTSQPDNCTGRQRVGAGTYTLYASLSGRTGTAAQFTIG